MQASVMETPYCRPARPSLGTFWLPGVQKVSFLAEVKYAVKRTLVDVALDHDAHDGLFTRCDLLGQDVRNLGLVLVVLLRVSVAAVDHEARIGVLLQQLLLGLLNALGVVVGALGAAAENDEAVIIADSADNGDDARLGDGQEVVGVLDRANGVNGDAEGAIGAVLEADGEGQARGKLAVQLALGRPGAHGTHAQQIGQELRRDCVQHLARDGHATLGQVDEELARYPEALVDLERVVNVGVVDQALPAHGGARFLEVGAHDDEQLVLVLFLQLQQAVAVFERHLGVVDGAGANNDEEPPLVVAALDDVNGLIAAGDDRLFRLLCLLDLVLQQVGRGQGVVAADAPVLRVVLVADVLVFYVELVGRGGAVSCGAVFSSCGVADVPGQPLWGTSWKCVAERREAEISGA